MRIERAPRQCYCFKCRAKIFKDQWRARFKPKLISRHINAHLICFINYANINMPEWRGYKRLFLEKHKNKLKEERGYRVLGAL